MKTALYSTLYPAIAAYLEPFFTSIEKQGDRDFDLWLGLDDMDETRLGTFLLQNAYFVQGKNDSPASLREKALLEICQTYDAVILVDSDDILLPERVQKARASLENCDAYGLALELIDEGGKALNLSFQSDGESDWARYLSRVNVFGFSNTAYRCKVLKDCFPIPKETVMVDWLVISQVVAQKASLYFDPQPHMLYRQYSDNTARVISPFMPKQIQRACDLVLAHYGYLFELFEVKPAKNVEFTRKALERQTVVRQFAQFIQNEANLRAYTEKINYLKAIYSWWEIVAHPDLEYLWQ